MRRRRVLALYAAFLCAFAVLMCRLFWLCSNRVYAARAAAQSTVRLALPARRGNFYDCKGRLLTGMGCRWLALCLPGQGSYTRLYTLAETAGQMQLYQKRNAARPFLLDVGQDVSVLGVRSYAVPRRYGDAPLAAVLLGYLDREGHGVAGLEAAFDAQLSGSGAHDALVCTVTAQGTLQAGTEPVLSPADSGAVGVQLTLSRPIQRVVEAAASQTMETGCVVVLDTATAKVRACVSLPGFDPEDVAASCRAGSRAGRLCLRLPGLLHGGWTGVPLCRRRAPRAGGSGRGAAKKLQRLLHPAGSAVGPPTGAGDGGAAGLRESSLPDGFPLHRCRAAAGGKHPCIQRGLCQLLLWAG